MADVVVEKGRRYALKVESVPRFFASARLVWQPPDPAVLDRAVAAARAADVVVAVVGITSDLEGEESGSTSRASRAETARAWACRGRSRSSSKRSRRRESRSSSS